MDDQLISWVVAVVAGVDGDAEYAVTLALVVEVDEIEDHELVLPWVGPENIAGKPGFDYFEHAGIPRPPLTGRHVGGLGLGVVLADALGDGFEFFGHVPHVVIVTALHDKGSLDVPAHEDCDSQADHGRL